MQAHQTFTTPPTPTAIDPFPALLRQYQPRVAATTAEYARVTGELLTLLRAQEQESDAVRFLMFRLDFNEYYLLGQRGRGEGRKGRFGSLLEGAVGVGAGLGGANKSVRLMV